MTDSGALLAPRTMFVTRGIRAVADGLMSASLVTLLTARGLKPNVGLVTTATLLGSALALLLITRRPALFTPHRVLIGMSMLMAITGFTFAATGSLLVLILVSLLGPLNPSSGDVSPFLPAEQTIVGGGFSGSARTRAMARFALMGSAGVALGAFLAGPIEHVGRTIGFTATKGTAFIAVVYGALGLAVLPLYLTAFRRTAHVPTAKPTPLGPSKRKVYELTAIFALDSAGGGMVVNVLIALWLKNRFGFDLKSVGFTLGLMSLAAAASVLIAPKLSARFGLVEVMVLTHAPANVLCVLCAFAPNAKVAVTLLLTRSLMSQLDVPPRTSFVMTLITPEERAAASAFTNLPRSIATASTPLLGGWLLSKSTFGWPLVIGGTLKLLYDVVLWVRFRKFSTRA